MDSGLGYRALDVAALQEWLASTLTSLGPIKSRLRRCIFSTHGATFAALRGDALAVPVPDYEWLGFDRHPAVAGEIERLASTLSPVLPRGLNLGLQLDWLESHHPTSLAHTDVLLPYAQYWAWWLSGVACSEVSSLGCHTLLWSPAQRAYSAWAVTRGWSKRFAPVRRAWEPLGTVRPALADSLGLSRGLLVYVGSHDRSACLAQYLRRWPRMTLVSTGTWVIVMAHGASTKQLDMSLDQVGSVSVRGDGIPSARFMGGRELESLCCGADPALASVGLIEPLLKRGLTIRPSFSDQGGPFPDSSGQVCLDGEPLDLDAWASTVPPAERATGAAIYAAYVTVWQILRLGGFGPVVVDGPFSRNAVIMAIVTSILRRMDVYASSDPVDGVIRGSWCLTRWTEPELLEPRVRTVPVSLPLSALLQADFDRWAKTLPRTARSTTGHVAQPGY